MCPSDISQSLSVVGAPALYYMVTGKSWKNMASVRTESGHSSAVMCGEEEHFRCTLMMDYIDWREIWLRMDTSCLWGDCTEAKLWQKLQFWGLSAFEFLSCIREKYLPPLVTSVATMALGEGARLGYRSDISQMNGDPWALHPSTITLCIFREKKRMIEGGNGCLHTQPSCFFWFALQTPCCFNVAPCI